MAGSRCILLVGGGDSSRSRVWTAGLFFTRIGRRILIGGVAAAVISVVAFPGRDPGRAEPVREPGGDAAPLLLTAAAVLPPLAIGMIDHPPFGVGTGMLQNARVALSIRSRYEVEQEFGVTWSSWARSGSCSSGRSSWDLIVALVRAYRC